MKKNHEIRVKLTAEQHLKIKEKAEALGLDVSSLIRMLVTKAKIMIE